MPISLEAIQAYRRIAKRWPARCACARVHAPLRRDRPCAVSAAVGECAVLGSGPPAAPAIGRGCRGPCPRGRLGRGLPGKAPQLGGAGAPRR